MGTFDTYNDSPNAIKNEGQEISLKFEKTSLNTGRVSWNVPAPSQGCSSDNQAYNGIIITLDTTHTTVKKSPVDGTIYDADITVDKDLHAGDKLDTSLVIGEFYNDKETTFLDISGLLENESYYISGYAVDKQNRYHSQGVHSYSLNSTQEDGTADTIGCQSLYISETDINLTDPTGLLNTGTFDFGIAYDVEGLTTFNCMNSSYQESLDYTTISINGSTSQTYGSLINTINFEFKKLDNPFISTLAPNTDAFYWDTVDLYKWNGYTHIKQDIIFEPTDPVVRTNGDLWFDSDTLHIWNGVVWNTTTYIQYHKDFDNLTCDDYWFNGTDVYVNDGNVWCSTVSYIQSTDPTLAPVLDCGSFWYDENTSLINKLSKTCVWVPTSVIYWNEDPNNLTIGTLWFNDLSQTLNEWNGISFDLLSIYVNDIAPTTPISGQYWFSPLNSQFAQYNVGTLTWDIISVLVSEDNPINRESCEIFWNSLTNDFFIWDIISSSWTLIPLIESAIDPISAPIISTNSIWVNTLNEIFKFDGMNWVKVDVINWPTDPTIRVLGEVWYDDSIWNVWDGLVWVQTEVVESIVSPTGATLPLDTIWFNNSNNTLQLWNGLSWVQISYSTTKLDPINGTLWLDLNDNNLKEWFKGKWNNIEPNISVSLISGQLKFCSKLLGHKSNVIIGQHLDNLFNLLNPSVSVSYGNVVEGTDGVSSEPSYAEIGVGDDGSPDERRELIDSIRHQLGYPTVNVELTKQQLDYCVDAAIEEIRKKTGAGYKRGFFFLDLMPGKQRYVLSHKGIGFNKIVSIQGIHRTSGAFLQGFDNGVFGQTAVNFLYNSQGFDLVSFHLYSSYVEELETLFATKILYQWNEQTRSLDIMQSNHRPERVLIDASVERTEQNLISDRYLKPSIESYALAQAMIILSNIRGKYGSLPGANGVSLNAADLYAQAQDLMIKFDQEIDEFLLEFPEEYGSGSGMIFG